MTIDNKNMGKVVLDTIKELYMDSKAGMIKCKVNYRSGGSNLLTVIAVPNRIKGLILKSHIHKEMCLPGKLIDYDMEVKIKKFEDEGNMIEGGGEKLYQEWFEMEVDVGAAKWIEDSEEGK